jgi:uncharacterized phage protein (TIGR02216 family)
MAVGLGLMRLSPAAFWAMTPREFAAALAAFASGGEEPVGRERLGELMRRYPDA